MSIRARDFDLLIRKFEFRTRHSGDLLAWFEHGGKVVVRAKRSHTPNSRDLPFQHNIRQQMKLNQEELRQALNCRIDKEGYVELLRRKGVI